MPRVVVNGGAKVIDAAAGRTLLSALMAHGLLVPSACGGRASCGQCRVRVTAAAPPVGDTERGVLAAEDIAAGVRLACQVPIVFDLEVTIPPSALTARPFRARVRALRDIAPDLREVDLALEQPREMDFRAGQYVQLFLPGTEEGPDPVYRAYSVASPPSSRGLLTLLVGRVQGGACSTHVFERLHAGDALRVNGPFGEFVVHGGTDPLLFVAGGSGMAPVRAMLLDLARTRDPRQMTLFAAARTREGLVYLDELRSLSDRLPRLQVVPTLTHPLAADGWTGETGGVAALLARRLACLPPHDAYLCGSPGMVDASAAVLRSRGLPAERIRVDRFA